MIEAVLFDLDNTLLLNDTQTFMAAYFKLLHQHVPEPFVADKFVKDVLHCTQVMMADTNTAVSNRDTFWNAFSQRLDGNDGAGLEAHFDDFYAQQFPQLQNMTERYEGTADLIQYCFDADLKVVVATNPVYPRQAIEHRLAWAGAPVTAFPYALVTDYANMHATKPHESYYREILDKIGYPPQRALMVGDSWENDIAPASRVGLFTYWITDADQTPPQPDIATAYGSTAQLYEQLVAGWLQS